MAKALDKAYAGIRAALLAGDFQPGARLKEEELAARFGVSRTPVREALRQLAAESFVSLTPNHGVCVPDWSLEELEESFALRSLLEGHAAERAAERIEDGELAEMRQLAEEMEAIAADHPTLDLERLADLNGRFHRIILDAARSRRLADLIRHVVELPVVLRTFRHYDATALERSMAHHRDLIAALAARDAPWAAATMRSHIASAWHTVRRGLRIQGDSVALSDADGTSAAA